LELGIGLASGTTAYKYDESTMLLLGDRLLLWTSEFLYAVEIQLLIIADGLGRKLGR
jgi:hypothetical protein